MPAATTTRREIRPQPGPQTDFLATPADIAIYGGSAGGGKTWAQTYEPLRHVHRPGFGAVIFRRESKQITNQGGLWDESTTLYPLARGVPRVGELDWTFPSGAKISFRHLQHEQDKLGWQGSQIPMLGFDELTHFTESQFWYMTSRNRSTCGIKPYVRAGTNPGPGWVKELLAQWVKKDHPDPARSGELRWFIREKGTLHWARTPEELIERFPADPADPKAVDKIPKSLTFIRASIFDNRILLAKDPGYLGWLQSLPEVERRQLLEGDWDVKREGLVYPDLVDCVFDGDPPTSGKKIGGMDFGWNNPFCALAGRVDHDDVLWVHFERYKSFCTLPTHSEAIPRDGTLYHADPAYPSSIAELNAAGHLVHPCVHRGRFPIKEGIDRVSERLRTGRLRISRACQNVLRESLLYQFEDDGDPTDEDNHAMDALRYMVTGLDRGRAVARRPGGTNAPRASAPEPEPEPEPDPEPEPNRRNPDSGFRWGGGDDDDDD